MSASSSETGEWRPYLFGYLTGEEGAAGGHTCMWILLLMLMRDLRLLTSHSSRTGCPCVASACSRESC